MHTLPTFHATNVVASDEYISESTSIHIDPHSDPENPE